MEPDAAAVRQEVERLSLAAPDGPGLTGRLRSLIGLAVAASPTTMDNRAAAEHAAAALAAGAASDELAEVVILASALGMHALHEAGRVVWQLLAEHDPARAVLPPDLARRRDDLLRDPYWARLDEELPNYLTAMLGLSPVAFDAFVEYCSVPWRHGVLRAVERELIYLALDATPTHRYLPGLRLHARNAIDRGATGRQLLETAEVAASAGPAHGIA